MHTLPHSVLAVVALGAFALGTCPEASGVVGSGDNIPHFQLNWSDEFNQGYPATGYPANNAPNPAVWNRDPFGVSTWYTGEINAVDGSGNDYERQVFMGRPENVRVANGALVIELRADRAQGIGWTDRTGKVNDLHTAAAITSRTDAGSAKPSFSRTSRVEFRAKVPHEAGVWPALWLMGTTGGWPGNGEFDVLEYWGRGTTETFGYISTSNIHWTNAAGAHAESMRYYPMRRPSDAFHVWAMERDAEKILMFYDDVLVAWHGITAAEQSELRDRDAYVIMNFCYTGIDPALSGVQLQVDYVREYLFVPGVRRHYPPSVGVGGNADTGAMIEAYANQPLPLVGSVSGDGMPGAGYTYEWEALSGPGTVAFSQPTSARTAAVFSAPGYYDVRLVAHDGQYGASAWRRVNVRAGSGNTAPVIAAAPRKVVAGHPVKVALQVADDGLPNNTLAANWWADVGNPTFSDKNSFEPTVTFPNVGTAIVKVRVSDGALSSTDARIDFEVVAPPAGGNQAPVVSAGDDQSVGAGANATLAGTVSDDGYPEFSTTQRWTQVSGPAQAVFSDPTVFAPTVNFPAGGTYVFRLTATDGAASASDTVSIVVGGPGNQQPTITTAKPAALSCALDASATLQLAATDADAGDTLAWSIGTPPLHGVATVGSAGLVRYTPAAGYVGADSFVARVSDGHGGVDTITINCAVVTTAPQVALVTATPMFVSAVGHSVALAATVEPGSGHSIDHVAFSLDGAPLGNGLFNAGTNTWNLSWIASALGPKAILVTAYGDDGQTATGTVSVVVGTGGTYGNNGVPWAAGTGTLRIEAENYDNGGEGVAFHDIDSRQGPSRARADGTANDIDIVEIDNGGDAPGLKLGYNIEGEWARYTVNVPATTRYHLRLRVSNGSGSAGALSLRWKGAVIAGPLSVAPTGGWNTFADIAVPGVTFAAGTDLLQLDCNVAGYDCNWIELTPAGLPPFASWIGGYFPGAGGDSTIVGAAADPDGDGLNNLLEYGMGRAPDTAEPPLVATHWTEAGTGNQYAALSFERAVGVAVVAEISDDLVNWSSAPADIVQQGAAVPDASGLLETVTFRSTAPLAVKPRQFLRVRVTLP